LWIEWSSSNVWKLATLSKIIVISKLEKELMLKPRIKSNTAAKLQVIRVLYVIKNCHKTCWMLFILTRQNEKAYQNLIDQSQCHIFKLKTQKSAYYMWIILVFAKKNDNHSLLLIFLLSS
jgi:hypothetical protein